MLRLTPAQTDRLLHEPESGMGFQEVDATLTTGRTVPAIVYNADLLFFLGESRAPLATRGYESLLKVAESADGQVTAVRVRLGPMRRAQAVMERGPEGLPRGTGAKDAPVEATPGDEAFVRFSAYQKDHRVLPDGSLSPGSFATTAADAARVKTGAEAKLPGTHCPIRSQHPIDSGSGPHRELTFNVERRRRRTDCQAVA